MYNKFFGFKEKPFKLVPNPAYFYLSKSHEEALAHLNYAISQGDGFVEITGEVGTGKTTLCRAFLESLNGIVEAAYIFNPKLGPKQLLRTINQEFGIKSAGDDTKELIDTLNAFLMQKKASGKKVILLIDEAQNLNRNVLEQLRLLSNLETNRDKLLQIVLVGQPELSAILNSYDLRQLGQRITLSYQLGPLTFNESKEYIQYRIGIAAKKTAIKFDRSAYRRIYKYSKGIPRLINIVCDRALLTAFVLNQFKITASITKTSIKELASRGQAKNYGLSNSTWVLMGLSFFKYFVPGCRILSTHHRKSNRHPGRPRRSEKGRYFPDRKNRPATSNFITTTRIGRSKQFSGDTSDRKRFAGDKFGCLPDEYGRTKLAPSCANACNESVENKHRIYTLSERY